MSWNWYVIDQGKNKVLFQGKQVDAENKRHEAAKTSTLIALCCGDTPSNASTIRKAKENTKEGWPGQLKKYAIRTDCV